MSSKCPQSGSIKGMELTADLHNSSPVREFDPGAERMLRRKTDFYIVPLVALLFLFCFIDRSNLGTEHHAELNSYEMPSSAS